MLVTCHEHVCCPVIKIYLVETRILYKLAAKEIMACGYHKETWNLYLIQWSKLYNLIAFGTKKLIWCIRKHMISVLFGSLRVSGTILLTWINFDGSMDK